MGRCVLAQYIVTRLHNNVTLLHVACQEFIITVEQKISFRQENSSKGKDSHSIMRLNMVTEGICLHIVYVDKYNTKYENKYSSVSLHLLT